MPTGTRPRLSADALLRVCGTARPGARQVCADRSASITECLHARSSFKRCRSVVCGLETDEEIDKLGLGGQFSPPFSVYGLAPQCMTDPPSIV